MFLIRFFIAVASSSFSFLPEPAAARIPRELDELGVTISILLPKLAMESVIFFRTPMPMEIMTMTAAMPIIMPSIVKMERSLLLKRAVKAMVTLSLNNIHNHPFSGIFSNQTVTEQQLTARTGSYFRLVGNEDYRFFLTVKLFENIHDFPC